MTHFKIRVKFGGQIPEKILCLLILMFLNSYQWNWSYNWLYFQKITGFTTFTMNMSEILRLECEKMAQNSCFCPGIFWDLPTLDP